VRGFDVPVGVDHAGSLLEERFDLRGHRHPARRIRPIDFGDEGLQRGRPRRHFRHLDGRAELFRDRNQPFPHASGNIVALRRAFALRYEVHLQIGEAGSPSQKVMPDEAVEIVGTRYAHVLLDVDDGLILHDGRRQRRRDARRRLERRALGHVDHDLELALVVERHHLQLHELERTSAAAASSRAATPARKIARLVPLAMRRPITRR
jgi:hypothetical protein